MYRVYLPKTEFNIYEKNIEEDLLKYWDNINLNELRKEKRINAKPFILHDGPPYANGPIHIGHAENKIWKDTLNKIFWQAGYSINYILGWDAHGLPIENAVEKKLIKDGIDKRALSKQEFWDACLNFANYWVEEQKKGFKKLGVFGDYDNSYITYNEKESIGIMKSIHNFVEKGLLIQKYRPVLWSYVEKTALAYAEVEYKDKISNSIYFSFPIVKSSNPDLINVNIIIWTTTPWTLPANEAVCYNEKFIYKIFCVNGKKYCVTKDLYEEVLKIFDESAKIEVVKDIEGSFFNGCIVEHCIEEFNSPDKIRVMIHGDHVDNEKGTGFVHIAPSHGEEDFEICKKNNIEIIDYLDIHGEFIESMPIVCGIHVKNAEKVIIDLMNERNLIIKIEEVKHSYPHSWRSKAPLIYRLTKQWFLNMQEIKPIALKIAKDEKLNWFPNEGKNRFLAMLQTRDDWCISRQRIWGVPLGIFYNANTGEVIKDKEFLKKTREIIKLKGVKNWSTLSVENIDPSYSSNDWVRVDDIVDIWFESGSTHNFVLKDLNPDIFPATVYLEGSDQHRGWFQSSLLISSIINGGSPWKNLITHGFCLDANKQKMSKSIGNVIDPLTWDIDTLRVFFASLNLSSDIVLSENSIKHAHEIVFRFKNTLKFLMGNLAISKEIEDVPYDSLPILEKWVLHKFTQLDECYDEILKLFYLNNFITKLYEFCAQDLSSFYFDVRKDTLYCEKFDNFERRSVITIFRIITPILIRYLSNFMPYSMEKAFLIYKEENDIKGEGLESVHLQNRIILPSFYRNVESEKIINELREIKKQVNEKIELLRVNKKVATSYEVKVISNYHNLDLLKIVLIVSKVKRGEKLDVIVLSENKCPRCKFYYETLVETLCKRCREVLK